LHSNESGNNFLYLLFLLPSGKHNLYANVKHQKSGVSSNQYFLKNQQALAQAKLDQARAEVAVAKLHL
jgi:multidrug resistance efflux pump